MFVLMGVPLQSVFLQRWSLRSSFVTESPAEPTTPPSSSGTLRAAIDIGTNSMHLVVARTDADGGFDILTTEKEMVRLGAGSGEMKELADDAIERGIRALDRMKQVAGSFGAVELVAVATSAVREASNRYLFLERARNEVGVEVDVISGFEEARLIHLGVLQALPVFDERILLVDIGGGSTEFLIGEGDDVLEARSMKLGAIRLTQRFFDGGVATPESVEQARHYLRAALAPVAYELGGHQPTVCVGSSGTISTIAAMAAAERGENLRQLNGATFTRAELEDVVTRVTGTPPDQRKALAGLDQKRTDIIVAGALLLSEVFEAFSIEQMTVSEFALREGALLDRGHASSTSGESRVSNLRRSNVRRLAAQLDPDPDHADHTALLATMLFDRTSGRHGLGSHERELLEAAAIVHNVGLFISHSSHHKHSYYVVRNSEKLTGFTDHEIEIMALVARYHRKSHPSPKHAEFERLSDDDKQTVRVLAGLLRVAIGLDRGHQQAVRSLRVFDRDDALVIEPVARAADTNLDLQIYAATERSGLLAQALGVDVLIQQRQATESEHFSS